MHRSHVRIETVAPVDELPVRLRVIGNRAVANEVQRLLELLRDELSRHVSAVTVQTEVAEFGVAEAIQDDIERGALFGDEQHRLAARDEFGDYVRDGLTLTRARRSADHAVLSSKRHR